MLIMIMASCCIGRSRLLRSVTREAASFPSSSSLLLPQILYTTITLPTYIHTQSLYTTLLNVARTYHPRHKKSPVTSYTHYPALGAPTWKNSCQVRNFKLQCSVEVPLLPSELPRGSEDEEVATQAPSPATTRIIVFLSLCGSNRNCSGVQLSCECIIISLPKKHEKAYWKRVNAAFVALPISTISTTVEGSWYFFRVTRSDLVLSVLV